MIETAQVRPLESQDLPEFVELCREHAEFERASWTDRERTADLERVLLDSDTAHCLVVETPDELAGFASANLELSTWEAKRYLHLDCLYLRPPYRGLGLGRTLVEQLARVALDHGAVNLQWQTPSWNDGAIRFYEQLGAKPLAKIRFTLDRAGCSRLLTHTSLPSKQ